MWKVFFAAAMALVACQQKEPQVIVIQGPGPTNPQDAGAETREADGNSQTGGNNPGEDASIQEGSPDAEAQDSGLADAHSAPPVEGCNVVHLQGTAKTITAEEVTCGVVTQKPSWASSAFTAVTFTRPTGSRKEYLILVYEKPSSENFEDWMRRSEIGDSYVSDVRVEIQNQMEGFVYVTDDHGEQASVHITVPDDTFVYYASSAETIEEVPEDFLQFMRTLRIE